MANAEKSEKSKHQKWAEIQENAISELEEPAKKFRSQLNRLFQVEEVDILFISERIKAAFNYFFPKTDSVLFDLLLKMEEVKRKKRVKEYFTELSELEESTTKAILQLFKAVKMVAVLSEGKEINKENLISDEIQNYRSKQVEAVQEHFKTIKNSPIQI